MNTNSIVFLKEEIDYFYIVDFIKNKFTKNLKISHSIYEVYLDFIYKNNSINLRLKKVDEPLNKYYLEETKNFLNKNKNTEIIDIFTKKKSMNLIISDSLKTTLEIEKEILKEFGGLIIEDDCAADINFKLYPFKKININNYYNSIDYKIYKKLENESFDFVTKIKIINFIKKNKLNI